MSPAGLSRPDSDVAHHRPAGGISCSGTAQPVTGDQRTLNVAALRERVPPGVRAALQRSAEHGFLGSMPIMDQIDHTLGFVFSVEAELGRQPRSTLDLGSGGGIPGLILSTCWPEAQLVLLDSNERRTAFLSDALIGLPGGATAEVVRGRAEEIGRDDRYRERFELVTARSFGSPAVTAECGAPLMVIDGLMVVSEPPSTETSRSADRGVARTRPLRKVRRPIRRALRIPGLGEDGSDTSEVPPTGGSSGQAAALLRLVFVSRETPDGESGPTYSADHDPGTSVSRETLYEHRVPGAFETTELSTSGGLRNQTRATSLLAPAGTPTGAGHFFVAPSLGSVATLDWPHCPRAGGPGRSRSRPVDRTGVGTRSECLRDARSATAMRTAGAGPGTVVNAEPGRGVLRLCSVGSRSSHVHRPAVV